ncbi:hypothetical protein EW146_g93 [Bondarzewia mesenterica]|uniref:NAD-dependent epimerase/dehydratase domain-containing protein n=1 Tax=Bondarzewia mesenterica TaxID=1095465 RepID=A0A4S4M831_9AGAM|nr:hypothetical protein EW146_g93 [Bondarzewia mesenterica]
MPHLYSWQCGYIRFLYLDEVRSSEDLQYAVTRYIKFWWAFLLRSVANFVRSLIHTPVAVYWCIWLSGLRHSGSLARVGYSVRGTVRSAKADRVRSALSSHDDKFEVAIVDDLMSSNLTDAFKGVDILIHVASPLPINVSTEEVLGSTINGIARVLEYALAAGVKKIVITSNLATVVPAYVYGPGGRGQVIDGPTNGTNLLIKPTYFQACGVRTAPSKPHRDVDNLPPCDGDLRYYAVTRYIKGLADMSLVLVTGASGYLGSAIVDQLLEAGYRVRGTVRSAKAERVRSALSSHSDKFEVTIVDDFKSSDLTDAFKGVDILMHVASPLPLNVSTEEVLGSAINGTTRVLEHALAAGVKKIVITSSTAAVTRLEEFWREHVDCENDWNTLTYEDVTKPGTHPYFAYAASKTLSEKAAWKFAQENPDIDLATVIPAYVYGPGGRGQVIDGPTNGTNLLIYSLIQGPKGRPVPEHPFVYPNYIHIADAARAHVRALNAPNSEKPKRIIAVAGCFTWKQAVEYLTETRPDLKDRLPVITGNEKECPEWVRYDNSSAARLLGMTDYIGWQETLDSTVDYLVAREKDLGITGFQDGVITLETTISFN